MKEIDYPWLFDLSQKFGFDGISYQKIQIPPLTFSHFKHWIDHHFYGTMTYLPRGIDKRKNPQLILENANSWITVYKHYPIPNPNHPNLTNPAYGRIAAYAQSEDYHHTLTFALKEFSAEIDSKYHSKSKVYVDTGPILERDAFCGGGNSFFGKNSCAILPNRGSFFFIGVIISTLQLTPPTTTFKTNTISCGKCTKCLDICPTNAFSSPFVLDARKCISYLTIEYKGVIPIELRYKMKNWIFGCDECQNCCPWNRFHPKELYQNDLPSIFSPYLLDLVELTEKQFQEMYSGTPVLRIGRNGFLRNVAIALTNWGSQTAKEGLKVLSRDHSTLVREHALWGIYQFDH